jgi:hypothetical protein
MIVAIFGYKGSGKSAVAERFTDRGYVRSSFATPLKEMLRVGFGLTHEQLYGDEKEVPLEALGGHTSRHAMTTLGKEWGREHIGPNAWVRAWMRNTPMDKNIVVDDLRFPNEADHLISLGAYFVKVERPGCKPEGDVHESEAHVDRLPWDLRIVNDGTLDNLTAYVEKFLVLNRNVSLTVEGARLSKLRQTLGSL